MTIFQLSKQDIIKNFILHPKKLRPRRGTLPVKGHTVTQWLSEFQTQLSWTPKPSTAPCLTSVVSVSLRTVFEVSVILSEDEFCKSASLCPALCSPQGRLPKPSSSCWPLLGNALFLNNHVFFLYGTHAHIYSLKIKFLFDYVFEDKFYFLSL